MINFRKQATTKFDENQYKFEQKRQKIDNSAKEKEQKKSEENKKNLNKIQINFKNSFVNEQTQQKYDKIIESNNKKNEDRKELDKVKIEEEQRVIREEEEPNNTMDYSRDNKGGNESEMILIESLATYKSRLNATNINETVNQTYMARDMDEEIIRVDNTIKEKRNEIEDEKFRIYPKEEDDTLKYDTEKSEDENNVDELDYNSAHYTQKNDRQLDIDEYDYNSNEPELEPVDSNENRSLKEKNRVIVTNQIDQRPLDTNEHNNEDEEIIEEEDIVYDDKVDDDEYEKYLEDTLDVKYEKTDSQKAMRQQMKNIIHGINDRKKAKVSEKGERKKILLNNLKSKEPENLLATTKKEALLAAFNATAKITSDLEKLEKMKNCVIPPKSSSNLSNTNLDGLKNNINHIKNYNPQEMKSDAITFGTTPKKVSKQPIVPVEEYQDFTHEEIIENKSDDILDEKDVTYIHHSVTLEDGQLANLQSSPEKVNVMQEVNDKVYNIDLEEFVQENTRVYDPPAEEDMTNYRDEDATLKDIDHIDCNIEEPNSNIDVNLVVLENDLNNRLLVFDNFKNDNDQ